MGDELPAVEAFSTLLEVRGLVQNWRIESTTVRPHSAWALAPLPSLRSSGSPTTLHLKSSGPATRIPSGCRYGCPSRAED